MHKHQNNKSGQANEKCQHIVYDLPVLRKDSGHPSHHYNVNLCSYIYHVFITMS